jgi:alkaline phosphatase D
MRKCILIVSVFLFFSQYLFAQKTKLPYCYQGDYTDSTTNLWCILKAKDTLDAVIKYGNEQEGFKEIKGTWNTYKKYIYGHVKINDLNNNSKYTIQNNDYKLLDFKTRKIDIDTTTLLVGSCAMMTFGWYWILRPKIKYPIYDVMSSIPNDGMIWMGDNIYLLFREPYVNKKQIYKYVRTRKVKQMAHFLQSTPQYTIWDDHDFGPNNSDGTFPFKNFTYKNFQDFWANPAPVDSTDGIYYSIQYPQVDVFLTDNRYHAIHDVRNFSDQQMKWLLEGLKSSTKPFKIIVTGDQANNAQTKHETLSRTGEFDTIINYIRENKITGVMFINGDRHHSEMFKHQIDGVYPIYEFTNSSLTSIPIGIGKRSPEYNNPARIQGVTKDHVFGKISIYPSEKSGIWTCLLSTINKKGKLLWEVNIQSDELEWVE